MIIQCVYAGKKGGEALLLFHQILQLFLMLIMIEITCVTFQGNYTNIFWNILVGTLMRSDCRIIPRKTAIFCQIGHDRNEI